jgi:hypothetical protein
MIKETLLGLLVMGAILALIHFCPVVCLVITFILTVLVMAYGAGYCLLDALQGR